jgi:signal transduction histidine kinase
VDYTHRRRFAASPAHLGDDPESPSGLVAEIVVADHGSGIPEDLLPQIFEPFVTSKEPGKGTGLGLAVCARLVEGMGGAIRAHNCPPAGAEFTVVLPLTPAEAGIA